ncbi:MAG TPA: alpha/beta hydrolase [Rhodanobacteraceae bacterium]|nr:alpha/beta hydrolase [Rhodanobacteraceae bacterium]
MSRRALFRIVFVGVALLALAGRWWMTRGHDTATTSTVGEALVQAHDGRGFTLGRLAFAPCELEQRNTAATTAAFCAPFRVPENWDKPDGRQIDLKLALVRSDAQVAERDPVVLLAGGPGQAATEVYPRAANGFAPLLRHRNLLLLDQRGTGGSHPLACKENPTDVDTAAVSEIDLDKVRALTSACVEELSKNGDPAQYTTSAAVRDLEALRQALGAPQYDLVGVSYGTRVAQQYLQRYPDGVRSVVLDSAVPNELVLGSEFAVNLDAALKAQFAECTKTPACAKAFGDPYASLYRLRDELAAKPAEIELRQPRTFAIEKKTLNAPTLAALVRMFAYSSETSALLPLTIARALDGDYAPLVAQSALLDEELSDLEGSGMQLSVICAEDADRLDERPQDAKLILGDALVRVIRAQCAIWPRGTRPRDFHNPVRSDKPVLVLEGEYDPVTPPRYGEAIVKGLPNGRLLVAKGQGHSVMGRGCLPRVVGRFVETLDAKALDAGCIADFGPTPAFVDYNGAGP